MDMQRSRRQTTGPRAVAKRIATPARAPTRRRAAPPRAPLPVPVAVPDPSFMRDSYASTALAEIIDRSVHAATARFTVGLSPMALIGAYMDWAAHLAFAPGKQAQLAERRPRSGCGS